MRLKRIQLKNFKRFLDFAAQFSPGINVVKGPLNEAGKSTLLEGILAALFANPKSSARQVKGYASWGSAKQCQVVLEFEDNGVGYLLEKDFDRGTIRLSSQGGGQEFDTPRQVLEKIAAIVGTGSEKLFSCTSCIRQAEVRAVSSGEREISGSLEEVVTGGTENVLASKVIEKLDETISEMKKGLDRPAKVMGVLAALTKRLEDTKRKYDEVKDEVAKVEAQKIELIEVERQLVQIKEEYDKAKALLEKNKQRQDIEAATKELEQKYDELEELLGTIGELATRVEREKEALRSIEGFEDERQVSELRKDLDAIRNRREDIEKDLAMRENELTEARRRLEGRKSVRLLGSTGGIAIALVLLIAGIIGTAAGFLYFLPLAILGAITLTMGVRARTTLVRDKTNILGIEGRIKDMSEALGRLDTEERELLAQAKCVTLSDFDSKERDFSVRLKEKSDSELKLIGMLRGKTVEDLQKQKREIGRSLAVEKAKLTDDLTATRLSPEEYIKLERNVQDLEEKQAALENRKIHSEAVIELAREKNIDADRLVKLEEELERLQEALKQEEKKVKIYRLAREVMSKARDETFLSANEVLEREIRNYFSIFTNGKYRQVKVSKEGLEFWVYSDEKGDWAKPEELSGGAIDEFYLASRLALVRLIFRDKKPPLILDDPFVNFDSVRLSNTLNFFRTLASEYQIVIFTLGDSYDKVADNIILLGEDKTDLIV
ncbi:MAG: ATP-binding protein [Dehalococcoidia bacterium]